MAEQSALLVENLTQTVAVNTFPILDKPIPVIFDLRQALRGAPNTMF